MSPLEVLELILKEDSSYRTEASEQFKDDLENSMTHMGLGLSYRLWTKRIEINHFMMICKRVKTLI